MSDQNFSRLPKPHTTYANIIKSFLPIGDQDKSANAVLPNATYSVNTLEIDHDNLADYRRICGFENNSYVPPDVFCGAVAVVTDEYDGQRAISLCHARLDSCAKQCYPISAH